MKLKEPHEQIENYEDWELQTAGKTRSAWLADAGPLAFQKLDTDISVDFVIVGGGIAGITTAYLLSKAGTKVAVLDDGNVGSGETGRTSAHITHALDDRYYNIEKLHGIEKAKLAAESHTAAIDMIESITREENINCNFERLDGYLFLDPTDKKKSLKLELDSTHRVGIEGTELLDSAPLTSFDTGPCIRFPDQAQFQPLKYLAGVARAIVHHGGTVFTETHVQDITSRGVKTAEGRRVHAHKIVVATNSPIVDKVSQMYLKQDAFRTYVIAAKVAKGAIPKALYWDTGNQKSKNVVPPYHYVRLQERDANHDLLIVGGEDHGTANASDLEKRSKVLEAWTRERFPIEEIEHRWSGQVMEPRDSLAFIGRNPRDKRGVFIATGDSGNGITHGTIAGMLLKDLILGRKNDWAALYDPSRRIKGHESAPYGGQPKLRKMKLDAALRRAKKLPAGEGMVAEILRKDPLAFYRDSNGVFHSYSAVCPHLECTVRWNTIEKSFDCPCHGSRFSCAGRVINGPANDSLEPNEEEESS